MAYSSPAEDARAAYEPDYRLDTWTGPVPDAYAEGWALYSEQLAGEPEVAERALHVVPGFRVGSADVVIAGREEVRDPAFGRDAIDQIDEQFVGLGCMNDAVNRNLDHGI